MRKGFWIFVYSITLLFVLCGVASSATLAVHPTNTRLFTGMDGKPLLLFGHQIFQDLHDNVWGAATYNLTRPLDWNWYLGFIRDRGINYVRNWSKMTPDPGTLSGHPSDRVFPTTPMPYQRIGPENASDGQPKFDLTQFNDDYFYRLSSRVADLQANGIYFSFMFFDVYDFGPWKPYETSSGTNFDGNVWNGTNNINEIDADTNGDGCALEFFYSPSSTILDYQKAFIRKVIDMLNQYDNVMWEINANELGNASWIGDMVDYIKNYESMLPKQHLVYVGAGERNSSCGITAMTRAQQLAHAGDVNSVTNYWGPNYGSNPPIETVSTTPMIIDMDHVNPDDGPYNKSPVTPWKALTRGYHYCMYDDPFEGTLDDATWELVRKNIGLIAEYSTKFYDLGGMTPTSNTKVCSTGYALLKAGYEYVFLQPSSSGKSFTASIVSGTYDYEWISISTGTIYSRGSFTQRSTGSRKFTPPISGPMAIYIRKSN